MINYESRGHREVIFRDGVRMGSIYEGCDGWSYCPIDADSSGARVFEHKFQVHQFVENLYAIQS
jgi:hypothetical protein